MPSLLTSLVLIPHSAGGCPVPEIVSPLTRVRVGHLRNQETLDSRIINVRSKLQATQRTSQDSSLLLL